MDIEYIIMAVLTIILVTLLALQSCHQPDVSDSYGISIKANGPAKTYVIEAGVEETIGELER